MQQFFTFNAKEHTVEGKLNYLIREGLDSILKRNGFTDEMKFELFIIARNKI